ncbi:transposase [Salipaludibacillus neizhouensis]|uniref:Transposase n=1 Tax=Salipaludibacillus neizhouensis TaxID=885475 RepID=A0A3A9K3J2_9BACI|nr:Mu transposase C-terminal domain-containing protein [Salipaludibacillus neizhouensis]RKL65858.1 transposase [Salipaludibacillus neizhouensis]
MENILVNSIFEWCNDENNLLSTERVLWISPNFEDVVLIRIDDPRHLPHVRDISEITEGLKTPFVRRLSIDPYSDLLNINEEFINKHKKNRDRAWDVIKDIVNLEPSIFTEENRGQLIKECMEKNNIGKMYIYKKLKQYWVGGKVKNALLPHYNKSGGYGKTKKLTNKKIGRPSYQAQENPEMTGINVTEEDKRIFKIAIKGFYEKSNNPELKFTYEQMIRNYYHVGYHLTKSDVLAPILPNTNEVPTYRQFRYWYTNEFNPKERYLQKEGEKKYNLLAKPNVGDTSERASGPGSIFEIDATIADIYLVSSLRRNRIIGRPVVYIVKDVFSRLVTGVYVGLEGPSWLSAMLALENTYTNKKEYCRSLGLNIEDSEWPAHHLPHKILADRGEMEGFNADKLTDFLGIQVKNAPPFRADLKGIVEQHFRTINTKIRNWTPGAVHKDYKERGSKDYRLDATLTLKAFEQIIITSILEHNQKIISNYPLSSEMIANNVTPTPINLWNWGIKHKQGVLKESNIDLIRYTLMPKGSASITRQGVYFNKRYYSSKDAIEKGWFEDASIKGRKKLIISFDPRSINHIYLKNEEGKLIQYNMINKLTSEDELEPRMEDYQEYIYARMIEEDQKKSQQMQASSDFNSQISAIIEEETAKTNKEKIPGESKVSRTKQIQQNRKDEKTYHRESENWDNTLKQKESFSRKVNSTSESEQIDDDQFILDMLINKSNKRRSSNE